MHRAWVRDGFQVSVVPCWVASERGMPGYVNVREKLLLWPRCSRVRPMRRASQEARGAGGARPREVPRAGGGQSAVGAHIGFIFDPILVGGFGCFLSTVLQK